MLLVLWDDDIAASREDEAQLRRDMKYHPRTSGRSLREMARMCSTQGSLHVQRRLDECYAWLEANRDRLPSEIEDENGNCGSVARLEMTSSTYEDVANDAAECDLEHGLYDVGQVNQKVGYYLSVEETLLSRKRTARLLHRHGLNDAMHILALRIRGKKFRKYNQDRKRWLRWGCYYADRRWYGDMRWAVAYGNTVAILDRVGRTEMSVLDLPGKLAELLELDGDVLRWKVARGTKAAHSAVTSKQVQIDGKKYSTSRIVKQLRDGWVSNYRAITGTKTLREDDGYWDITFWLDGVQRTVMECNTEEEADKALWAVRWAIYHYQ